VDRPILNPHLSPDDKPSSRSSWKVAVAKAWLSNAGRMFWRIFTYNPLRKAPLTIRIEDGTFWQKVFRGVAYRLAFVPLLAALSACALVYSATHPPVHMPGVDPTSQGIYYDPVSLVSDDGTRFEGWLVPVLEPKQVLEQKELLLRTRRPAVVLLHDHGQSREQMIPLIQPLHDAGFVVMAISLRGRGGGGPVGATFGLREATDVRAAVELLRRRPFVDPTKIALVGVGTGANAALIAAAADSQIAAVAAVSPVKGTKDLLTRNLGPKQSWLGFMSPLCRWTFELAYSVDMNDLELSKYEKLAATRPVLIDRSESLAEFGAQHTKDICEFLDAKLPATTTAAVDPR
jgi:pimeloyl-ACP methyl ester carboxylesterase